MKLFHKHNPELIGHIKFTQQEVYKCNICGKYQIFHYGVVCKTGWMKSLGDMEKDFIKY